MIKAEAGRLNQAGPRRERGERVCAADSTPACFTEGCTTPCVLCVCKQEGGWTVGLQLSALVTRSHVVLPVDTNVHYFSDILVHLIKEEISCFRNVLLFSVYLVCFAILGLWYVKVCDQEVAGFKLF